ncbi:MAG: 16S rRNA (cytidine(1402)-2'-O)-methyltransferase [Spirochaetota bacterium]
MKKTGTLYIIATPLGNLQDMTYRAVDTLKNDIDIVYCEDTRVTRRLLSAFDINLPTHSLHSHSSVMKVEGAVEKLRDGKNIAYMSDCGTPGVSDPGSRLVQVAAAAGIQVVPLPGVSALTAIVSVSGFASRNILFAGFISKKPGRRINELSRLAEFDGTIVLYESPHRITKTLLAIAEIFPDKNAVLGREMTKLYEEYTRYNTSDTEKVVAGLTVKGEFCIAIDNTA